MNKEQMEELSSNIASSISVWNSFIGHAGWKALEEVIKGQLEQLGYLVPLQSMDEVLGQEFKKGQLAFGKLILSIPEVELERLRQEAATLQKEIDDESSFEQRELDGAASGSRERWGRGSDGNALEPLDPAANPFGTTDGL